MSNLGMGVMIKTLGGNEGTVNAIKSSLNKIISDIKLIDNCLVINFTDNSLLKIWDSGQSCCEHRYMTTDDNLKEYIGAMLLDFELKSAPPITSSEWGDEHEIQFLDVKTDKGIFTMANHNEHNGYYGGFWIEASNELENE